MGKNLLIESAKIKGRITDTNGWKNGTLKPNMGAQEAKSKGARNFEAQKLKTQKFRRHES